MGNEGAGETYWDFMKLGADQCKVMRGPRCSWLNLAPRNVPVMVPGPVDMSPHGAEGTSQVGLS